MTMQKPALSDIGRMSIGHKVGTMDVETCLIVVANASAAGVKAWC